MANDIECYMSRHAVEFATHHSISCEISGKGGRVLWEKNVPLRNCLISGYSSFISIQPLGRFSRTQSPVRRPFDSGTLHPGQVLRGCYCFHPPLDLPTFSARCLHVQRSERPLAAEGGTLRGREMFRQISSRIRLPRKSRDILHAANLRHGTDGFTSRPKEGVLRILPSGLTLKNSTWFPHCFYAFCADLSTNTNCLPYT